MLRTTRVLHQEMKKSKQKPSGKIFEAAHSYFILQFPCSVFGVFFSMY